MTEWRHKKVTALGVGGLRKLYKLEIWKVVGGGEIAWFVTRSGWGITKSKFALFTA